jgi:hypothetical protein
MPRIWIHGSSGCAATNSGACPLNLIRRFADDLEVADNGVLNLLVLLKSRETAKRLYILNPPLYRLCDVLQIVLHALGMSLHRALASSSTR